MRRTTKCLRARKPSQNLREAQNDIKQARVALPAKSKTSRFKLRFLPKSCQSPLRRVDFLEETFPMLWGGGLTFAGLGFA